LTEYALLLVDDEGSTLNALRRTLRTPDRRILAAHDGLEAISTIQAYPSEAFAVAIVDLKMPRMDGMKTLLAIKRCSPATQVLMLTGHGSISDAVEAMRAGADDFLEKPFEPEFLRAKVVAAERQWAARRGAGADAPIAGPKAISDNLIGASEQMDELRRFAFRMGNSDVTILIRGESGTGKGALARAIHFGGRRARKPFVSIDTPTLSATMIESELFGHSKGAYTGAVEHREGLLRTAGKGTVFLDEIGDLPLPLQTKLLRVLQERLVRPVGMECDLPIEARFIAATNRDMAAAVESGRFREDLYHRLNVVNVVVPPLREHKPDIPILAERFLKRYVDERPTVTGFSHEVHTALLAYDWPGNVRELENIVLRAVVLGAHDVIQLEDLPEHILHPASSTVRDILQHNARQPVLFHSASEAGGSLACYEQKAILSALKESGGNRAKAAAILKIGVATLYRKMKKYKLR